MLNSSLPFYLKHSYAFITGSVLIVHLLILILMLQTFEYTPLPLPPKLLVQTIQLNPPKKTSLKPIKIQSSENNTLSQIDQPLEPKPIEKKELPKDNKAHASPTPAPAPAKPLSEAKAKPLPHETKLDKATSKATPVKEVKPVPAAKKKPEKQVVPKKNTSSAPSPTLPTNPSSIKKIDEKKQKLIAQAQENLAKIEQNKWQKPVTTNSPSALAKTSSLTTLNIDSISFDSSIALSAQETSYREELAKRLKIFLTLPEHGEIQIKLTLKRNGQVSKLAIIQSKSHKNQIYLENNLTHIQFPPFGDNFGHVAEYTFAITLEG